MRYRYYFDPLRGHGNHFCYSGCLTSWVFADEFGPIYYRATEAEVKELCRRANREAA